MRPHYHDNVTAVIEQRKRAYRARGRIAKGLTALLVAGAIAAGAVAAKSDRRHAQEPALATPQPIAPGPIIATGIYEGSDIRHADTLARDLERFGYTIERQGGERHGPAGRVAQTRLIVHTPDYASERRLLLQLAGDKASLPGGTDDLLPGQKLPDGSYRFSTFDEHLERLVDRYVADAGRVRRSDARMMLLRYLRPIIRQESGYKSWVTSKDGAIGLMQVTPDTAVTVDKERAIRYAFSAFRQRNGGYDPAPLSSDQYARLQKVPLANLDDGVAILWRNYADCDGDMTCALASYNAGPGNAARWSEIPETRQYVRNIHAMARR